MKQRFALWCDTNNVAIVYVLQRVKEFMADNGLKRMSDDEIIEWMYDMSE